MCVCVSLTYLYKHLRINYIIFVRVFVCVCACACRLLYCCWLGVCVSVCVYECKYKCSYVRRCSKWLTITMKCWTMDKQKNRKYERPAVRMEDEHFRINFDSVVVLDLCCLWVFRWPFFIFAIWIFFLRCDVFDFLFSDGRNKRMMRTIIEIITTTTVWNPLKC